MRRLSVCLICLPLFLACREDVTGPPGSEAAARRTFRPVRVDLGTLGGVSSYANDINRSSVVVGSSDTPTGLRHAFRWTVQGGMTDLGTLPGDDWSDACCITDDGRILGTSGSSSVSTTYGTTVVWSPDGAVTALEIPLLPGGEFGVANGFNAAGDVVGWEVVTLQHAWVWNAALGKYDITAGTTGGSYEGAASAIDGTGRVLGTSNSRTAGCSRVTSCWRPFWWSEAGGYREIGTPEVDSTAVAVALGMGDGPTAVGWARTNTLGSRPYVWREGAGFTILPTPAGGYATAINRSDLAVGVAWHPELGAYQATAWRRSGDAIRLSPDDSNTQIALAVNDLGVVVGWSARTEGNHATLWVLGPASAELVALATREPLHPAPSGSAMSASVAASAAATCLSNPDVLVSRGAVLACARDLPTAVRPR